MCCGFVYPNSLGLKIAALVPGTEIIILKGEGYPAVAEETIDYVWLVDGFSALTAGGIAINCMSISDLITTGRIFEEFEVSEAAKAVKAMSQDSTSEPNMRDLSLRSRFDTFDIEPE